MEFKPQKTPWIEAAVADDSPSSPCGHFVHAHLGFPRRSLRSPVSPVRISSSARHAAALLRQAIDENYSYRDLRRVNWTERFKKFALRIRSTRTAEEFADEAARLLAPARDIHLWLQANGRRVPTFSRGVQRNVSFKNLPRLVPCWLEHNTVVATGSFPSGIQYLCIRGWPAHAVNQLRPAYALLRKAVNGARPLIIDMRANGGGSEPLAARFAGCFIRHPVCYAKHLTRRAGKFLGPFERWLKPNRRRPHYAGTVAVLIGPGTVSSCESFALMMRLVPGCKLIGQPTAGASGNPLPFDLGNGVVVYVPSWKDLDLDGVCIEGRGVAPDILVHPLPSAFADPVLTSALRFLRANKRCFFTHVPILDD